MRKIHQIVLVLLTLVLCCGVLPAATAETLGYYTVAKGDTLQRIANRHDTTVDYLMSLNDLYDADVIFIGEELRVPISYTSRGLDSDGGYQVRSGDTLRKIARRFSTTVQAIVDRNGIDDPDRIHVGQILLIDSGSGSSGSSSGGSSSDNVYIVQKGDTVSRIAHRFRIDVEELIALNGLSDRDLIYVGQWMIIR